MMFPAAEAHSVTDPLHHSPTSPRPVPRKGFPLWAAGGVLLLTCTNAKALLTTCSLRHADSPNNPVTVTAQLQPTSGMARILGRLRVNCQLDLPARLYDWNVEIGASNSRGGLTQRTAQLITNPAIHLPYALTRHGQCANAATNSDWFGNNTIYTHVDEGQISGSTLAFDVPFCLTVGYLNNGNLMLRAGTYRDNVRFNMTYGAFYTGGAYGGTTTLDMVFEVTVVGGCIVSTSPGTVAVDYPSFSPVLIESSTLLGVTCNPDLPWQARVDQPSGVASQVGLPYTVHLSPDLGAGQGSQQLVGITVRLPANTGGRCAGPQCTETVPLGVLVDY